MSTVSITKNYFVPTDNVCRVVFKNGMRYDLILDFEYSEADKVIIQNSSEKVENENWPVEKINRFWFIQVQAMSRLLIRSRIKSTRRLLLMTAWLSISIPNIKTGGMCFSISGKVTISVLKTNPDF